MPGAEDDVRIFYGRVDLIAVGVFEALGLGVGIMVTSGISRRG